MRATILYDRSRIGPSVAAWLLSVRAEQSGVHADLAPMPGVYNTVVLPVQKDCVRIVVGIVPSPVSEMPHAGTVILSDFMFCPVLDRLQRVMDVRRAQSLISLARDTDVLGLDPCPEVASGISTVIPYLCAYEMGAHVSSDSVVRVAERVAHAAVLGVGNPAAKMQSAMSLATEFLLISPENEVHSRVVDEWAELAEAAITEHIDSNLGKIAVSPEPLQPHMARRYLARHKSDVDILVCRARGQHSEPMVELWGHGDAALAYMECSVCGNNGHAFAKLDKFKELANNEMSTL